MQASPPGVFLGLGSGGLYAQQDQEVEVAEDDAGRIPGAPAGQRAPDALQARSNP